MPMPNRWKRDGCSHKAYRATREKRKAHYAGDRNIEEVSRMAEMLDQANIWVERAEGSAIAAK